MFKKQHSMIDKSISKVLDVKNDCFNRMKHLKIVLDNFDANETKNFFTIHFRPIYYVFFNTLTNQDVLIKQKGQKQIKEEQDSLLFIFEKILVYLPELIEKKWQFHSISIVMRKLLNNGNSAKVTKEGIRLFLIWYQILGDIGEPLLEQMFASLVPGLIPNVPNIFMHDDNYENVSFSSDYKSRDNGNIQNDPNILIHRPTFQPCDIEPLVPFCQDQPKDPTNFYLQWLMDYMVSQVSKIHWEDAREAKQKRCFEFLFGKFREIYLPIIFPDLNYNLSYEPNLNLDLRIYEDQDLDDQLLSFKCIIIRWFAKFMRRDRIGQIKESSDEFRLSHSFKAFSYSSLSSGSEIESKDFNDSDYELVRNVIYNNQANLNLIHEIFRQAFMLPFSYYEPMQKVINVYKDWINNMNELPVYVKDSNQISEEEVAKIKSQAILQVFIQNGAHVFLLLVPQDKPTLLDKQVDMCKRVLNIYRFVVMKKEMSGATWELLLLVMLRITSLVFSEIVPNRKEDVLCGRLAPAYFQTLIVTWIKANLNVYVPANLWEQFKSILSSLIQWEELIKEWSKTVNTITRVMCRYVYDINLNDLPLDRLNEKKKRQSKFENKYVPKTDGCYHSPRLDESVTFSVEKKHTFAQKLNSKASANENSTSTALNTNFQTLQRSASDTILMKTKQHRKRENSSATYYLSRKQMKSRSRSYSHFNEESPYSSRSSVHFRSPSPTPSSGIETTSLKDSPWQIEVSSLNSNINSSTIRSVIAGGTTTGWCAESSVILWRRMVGILGDINEISDPSLHEQLLNCIAKVVEDFIKVRDNQGVFPSNLVVTPLVPPIHYFASWLFKALELPNEYKKGKIIALKLLCLISIKMPDNQLTNDYLSLFYRAVHKAIFRKDLEMVCTIIKYTGIEIFSSGLKGSSILLLDFVEACKLIVHSKDAKEFSVPRYEALSFLGSLLSMTEIYKGLKVLNPYSAEIELIVHNNSKDKILKILIKASEQEPSDLGKSVSLNCLGILLYQEIKMKHISLDENLYRVIDIFLTEAKSNNRYLPRIACDMLRLQCEHANYLLETDPSICAIIIDELVLSLYHHLELAQKNNFLDCKNILIAIIFCLGEWCMVVSKKFLIETSISRSQCLLQTVIQALISTINICSDKKFEQTDEITDKTENLDEKLQNTSSLKVTKSVASIDHSNKSIIMLAAKMLLGHLYNFLDHFPLPSVGASRLSSLINETDDNSSINKEDDFEDLTFESINSPNVLMFMMNSSSIVSFIDLGPEGNPKPEKLSDNPGVRIIVRDLVGKFSWDCSQILFSLYPDSILMCDYSIKEISSISREADQQDEKEPPPLDPLDLLLKNIEKSLNKNDEHYNIGGTLYPTEENMIALLSNQHYQEMNFVDKPRHITSNSASKQSDHCKFKKSTSKNDDKLSFTRCRQMIDQLGLLFWEKRPYIDLLNRNEKLLRELRNLDHQKCRETHKIAIIYVAEGQEDKNSILMNTVGSEAFEKFVSGVGWEVDLESHYGFRGGLQQNKSTGVSAPYFASPFFEVIFHVSTRIPVHSEDADSLRRKLTHLGNDEVHIVWSEHSRDYRREIIPTEFCDVLIVIYPLAHFPGYHRIDVSRKPEVPFFGPIYSGAIVHHSILSDLVRATAINASRASRMPVQFYQNYFEERTRSIETINMAHKDSSSFEDFASSVYAPITNSLTRPLSSLSGNVPMNDPNPNELFIQPSRYRHSSMPAVEHKLIK